MCVCVYILLHINILCICIHIPTYSFLSTTLNNEAKQIIVMCLKNSSTQIIIHCFAWKYYFINYKIFSSRNASEDQVRKGNALFQTRTVTKEKCASFLKNRENERKKSLPLKIEIKCLPKCKIQHKMDMIIIATHCTKFWI